MLLSIVLPVSTAPAASSDPALSVSAVSLGELPGVLFGDPT
jgi:hypothetical protein